MKVYFDNAATTAMDDRVIEAMLPFMKNHYGNPSSVHSHGREVRSAIEKSRKKVAELLNTTPAEIFFTSGGTEADNTALVCGIETHGIKHAITSPVEHHAVLHTLEVCEQKGHIQLSKLDVNERGELDLDQLEALLKANPNSLISLMHANNEIGNLNDLNKIGSLAREYGAFFHSDTVQTMGHYVHDLKSLPIDALVAGGHKFHGPKGSGFLYVRKDKKIHPFIHGGAQERNMRGGTENVIGIIGIAKALEIAYEDMAGHESHIKALKKHFVEKLKAEIPGVEFNGMSADLENSLYTVLNVSLPPSEANAGMLLFNLDLEGISASGGSACSSGATVGSHVLRALNHNPERDSVRFSFSRFNNIEEVDYTIGKLKELYPVEV
ncbi:MAG TPA: cysteine desulfurase [Algoriphagus sp.]|jgi:cysteine desulfurase|uniref:cysteine desulfurase family protein n=1 Tax=unclassified Algoriphagus TaxID=2641541 RepID=UPI000C36E5CB|nr:MULTISPECIES: cysteine desulfurase family protein [unclassified Algoriphagus]MAL15961.1 cysteine desulfurase [Algoriphagus sp.]QYH40582.1 cysteine desulfurase [Algoriphagus sp. NBT04N3]HAH38200.1 cysteine desulfurase [Algoriphagus sp.]HAS59913.1 cysteine desulfurase [Algoriphagus sp.]HCB45967.1 cysteine desulfurase [Algoriphagus sp.]|tara:strand:+ start:11125 stop:12267 length:1143 start_codon:yes stop_codon:yes gene_type:complete